MSGKSSYMVRALYIVLIPVVLMIILLNSGWLQRLVPAATMNGKSYTVVQYNYYYFECYNAFLNENEDHLDELGYDPDVSNTEQYYSDSVTWEEYFKALAEELMAKTAYYCDLADAAGYVFSEEELAKVGEIMADHESAADGYGISLKNYYIAYYGSGMNKSRYENELTKVIKAEVYEAYLEKQYVPDEADIAAWLEENPQGTYDSAQLQVITLEAQPNRSTEEVGSQEISALTEKLNRLMERYESGVDFTALQVNYSTYAVGDSSGAITVTAATELPDEIKRWCLENQENIAEGDTFCYTDEETGTAYFAVFLRLGEDGGRMDAVAALSEMAIQEQETEALASYEVTRNTFGILLATS